MPPAAPDPAIERQRAEVEAEFRHGSVPAGADESRTLTAAEFGEARRILDSRLTIRRLTYLEPETIQAVRHGAQPGDPLPPRGRTPLIEHVSDDAEVIITGDAQPRVAVLFSHDQFPGVRFGHRLQHPAGELARYETTWLAEALGTGSLHRMMRTPPPPDESGITWTTWR
jgi:hypothetical protein